MLSSQFKPRWTQPNSNLKTLKHTLTHAHATTSDTALRRCLEKNKNEKWKRKQMEESSFLCTCTTGGQNCNSSANPHVCPRVLSEKRRVGRQSNLTNKYDFKITIWKKSICSFQMGRRKKEKNKSLERWPRRVRGALIPRRLFHHVLLWMGVILSVNMMSPIVTRHRTVNHKNAVATSASPSQGWSCQPVVRACEEEGDGVESD